MNDHRRARERARQLSVSRAWVDNQPAPVRVDSVRVDSDLQAFQQGLAHDCSRPFQLSSNYRERIFGERHVAYAALVVSLTLLLAVSFGCARAL